MCIDKDEVMSIKDRHSELLDRCDEVIRWKNNNCQGVFDVGGIFDTSVPLFIVSFSVKGVYVTNGTQTTLVSYDEIGSDDFRENIHEQVSSDRKFLRRGLLNV